MNSQIEELISRYEGDGDFTHVAPSEELLGKVKEELGVDLPDQYLDYLKAYSHGGVGGIEVLGIGFDGSIAFLEETLGYRDEGLPDGYVVVENCDEWLYCIDCATGEVASWSPDEEAMVE